MTTFSQCFNVHSSLIALALAAACGSAAPPRDSAEDLGVATPAEHTSFPARVEIHDDVGQRVMVKILTATRSADQTESRFQIELAGRTLDLWHFSSDAADAVFVEENGDRLISAAFETDPVSGQSCRDTLQVFDGRAKRIDEQYARADIDVAAMLLIMPDTWQTLESRLSAQLTQAPDLAAAESAIGVQAQSLKRDPTVVVHDPQCSSGTGTLLCVELCPPFTGGQCVLGCWWEDCTTQV